MTYQYEPIPDIQEWSDGALAWHRDYYIREASYEHHDAYLWVARVREIAAEMDRRGMTTEPSMLRRLAREWKEELDAGQ